MMTDTAVQQQTDTNGQVLITQSERDTFIQRLTTKFPLDLSNKIDMLAYAKSNGIKAAYVKILVHYSQQAQTANLNRAQQQRQQQLQQQLQQQQQHQTSLQTSNNNVDYLNQQLNLPQQPSVSLLTQPQHTLSSMLNQPIRFSPIQPSLQSRMTNQQGGVLNTQPSILNQVVRLRDPQNPTPLTFNTISYSSTPSLSSTSSASTLQTTDLSQSFSAQPQVNSTTLNDYLSQPSTTQNRYSIQQAINSRAHTAAISNVNFAQTSASNNTNDVLHKFVVGGNPPTISVGSATSVTSAATSTSTVASSTMMTAGMNTSSTGDRLLQQILLSNNDGLLNKRLIQNRQASLPKPSSSTLSQPIRLVNSMNSAITDNTSSLRSSLTSQPSSTVQSTSLMPTKTQTPNVQVQPSPNITAQQSPMSSNSASFSATLQSMSSSLSNMNNLTPLTTNYSSPVNRSMTVSGTGNISSPDEEIISLIKYLKENLGKLQAMHHKYTNEGQLEKARNIQAVYQQMVQFINNPTYEALQHARSIRDNLERASSRSQQLNSSLSNVPTGAGTTTTTNVTTSQGINFNQVEKAINEYISRDQRKRIFLSKLFVEPLSDVINGVPHKKIRLDNDNDSNKTRTIETSASLNQSSLLSHLYDELVSLPSNIFLIEYLPISQTTPIKELNDDYVSKNGLVLRCKLSESSNPLVPPLRIRISTRYPQEQPEILSLTQTTPPKLEFTDGHPFFERISILFVSYLFKLPTQYTVTDILNIWRQSVQVAM